MADRVHPQQSPTDGDRAPASEKSLPLPGTYVVQVPKDQIYRHPPENARRFESFSHRKNKRSCCCRCFCYTTSFVAILLVLLAVAAGILYLVFRPKLPEYSIEKVSIIGFNLSSSAVLQSIDVAVRADNTNRKIGIDYLDGSSIDVFFTDVNLCHGTLPVFYQPSKNITVFSPTLNASRGLLSTQARSALMADQRQRSIPLAMKLKAPIKIKFGSVKTWKITAKVSCDIAVDNLTASAKIVSKQCDVRVKLWD